MNTNMFNGMFGMIEPGMCRMSMSGAIAVKTSNGYKSYNLKKGRLTNCDGFVFNIGEEFFFVIPTNKAEVGDILLVNKKPKCVVKIGESTLTVVDYEDSSIKEILPERHVFMGNTYFYGKIVSLFGNTGKGTKGAKNMMKMMAMSSVMGQLSGSGPSTSTSGNMANMLPYMMMFNGGDMFDGMFDFDDDGEEVSSNILADDDSEEDDK